MRILLDECVNAKLKKYLSEFEVFTVSGMKWNGTKNGKLISLCCAHNFDLLLTVDKNLMYQQNLEKYKLTIVVLNSTKSQLKELALFMPSFKSQISKFEKGKVYMVEKQAPSNLSNGA